MPKQSNRVHGTEVKYSKDKCRCNLCKKAKSEYDKLAYKKNSKKTPREFNSFGFEI